MNIKAIALVGLAAYGIWYATIGGKRIDEADVSGLYKDYWAAFDKADGKAVCDLFTDKVTGHARSTARSMPVAENFDKQVACTSVEDFYKTKKKLEDAMGEEMFTNVEFHIKSITISPDKKRATVEVHSEMRIGTEQRSYLDMRVDHTDEVVKSWGKPRFDKTDSVVSFFH